MKIKNLFLGLGLAMLGLFAHAQNGLESVVVERYYVATAADAAASTGILPVGSVTYRIYADMLPGYKFQAAYGATVIPDISNPSIKVVHALKITSTSSFFNNEDRGSTSPTYTKAQAALNTVMLDSWLTVGGAAAGQFGVLKTEDNVALGGATVLHPAGVLANSGGQMGIALTAQDGLWAGAPQSITLVGPQISAGISVFDATSQTGGDFTITDAAWSALSGAVGPTATNRVLLGQFTTDGDFHFELNIQIGTPSGGTEKYVASNPIASNGEITIPSLTQTLLANPPANVAPVVNITAPAATITVPYTTVVPLRATATDADGTVAQVQFFDGATSLGIDFTAPYQAAFTAPSVDGSHPITAVATDNEGLATTSAVRTINVGNSPPTASITAPAAGTVYIVGDVVTINATSNDTDGQVNSLQIKVDGVAVGAPANGLLASLTASAAYTSVLGVHTLTATATDNNGGVFTSAPVSITVNANQLPTVALGSISATPALGVPLTLTATASDPDGTIASVEFYNNGVFIPGTVTSAAGVYSLTFTPSVQGATSFTAKATDNKGGIKVSVAVPVVITDLSAAYLLGTVSQPCNIEAVCLPITTNGLTVTGINGFNFSIAYNKAKVKPTGNVTVSNALILPFLAAGANAEAITDYTTTVDEANGIINIGINFNATGGANPVFTGIGQVACVEFNKTTAFQSVDTAVFSFTEIIESYRSTPAVFKSGSIGKFITYKEDKMYASLKFWSDLSPIKYDIANPSTYLASNVFGCGLMINAVQPDMAGNFVYSILNGTTIDVRRDIDNTTNVHSVIDEQDAYLTSLVSVKGTSKINWTPSVMQMIAMDVNRDGLITSGDATQINQRAVRLIDEFIQGEFIQLGGLARDWSFVANTKVNSDLSYLKSVTFPENDTHGYSKYKVPVVAVCQNVPVIDPTGCPVINNETYIGILIGDVDASYAGISPNGTIKSAEATGEVVFNLLDAVKDTDGNLVVPVSLNSTDIVNSFGFDVVLNDQKMTVKSVAAYGVNLNWNYFSAEKMLQVAAFSLNEIPTQNTATLTVTLAGAAEDLTMADFNATLVKINGKKVTLKVVDASMLGVKPNTKANNVNVYPNPASDKLNIEVSSDSKVQMLDLNGKKVVAEKNVNANQKGSIDVSGLAKGVYMMKVYNANSVTTKKVVIK